MPWGAELPRVTDDLGQQFLRGPTGGLFQGVQLRNYSAIATLSVRAYLSLTDQSAMLVDGFNGFEARYPAAANAGRLIARLVDSLRAVTRNSPRVPHFYAIINRALEEPDLSYEAHRNNILRILQAEEADNARPHGHDNRDRGRRGDGLGARDDRDNRRQSQDSESSSNPDTGSSVTNSGPSGSSKPSGPSPIDHDVPGELIFSPMRDISGKKSNRPPPRGDWEFVEGTNLDDTILGQPDPSKFFLVRQMHSKPDKKDVRQYPGWEKMDWNDPDHIASLNRARRQVRMRTSGAIAEPRLPWTQLEKDILKELVQDAIDNGQKRKTIDWDAISAAMSKRFEGVVQKKGEPLAQMTNVVNGVEQQPKRKTPLKLKTERKGAHHRGPRAMQNQAEKYGDIELLLNATQPKRGRKRNTGESKSSSKHEIDSPENRDEESADDTDSDSDAVQPKQKRPRGPKDMPDRTTKPPGPPPPFGGAGGIAGPMEKSCGLAPPRTTISTR
jgi:hypothetical protein